MAERRDSFYGRRKGKKLRPAQAERLARLLPILRIDTAQPPPDPLFGLFSVPVTAIALEIGFGGGERLIDDAANAPQTGFIGVEVFEAGLAKAVSAIAGSGLANIRLYDGDAGPLLDWLPAGSIARIDLFYPDPWPKRRHWKRRFVNAANLKQITRVLAPGGMLRFASDIAAYVDWTLQHVWRQPGLAWTAQTADDWRRPWPDWPGTRYEAKAIGEGRRPAYLTFCKAG
ncbi:MAG: tRNA (guanosine(46)-N7)-methyltransferase TrmB [Hyphomicrobiales bacterium]|nr:tRNA (guanosine(46)-N7)-methyltransferase TrmB [Hyphomicrobiales bacterium]